MKYPHAAGFKEDETSAEAADKIERTGRAQTIRKALLELFESGAILTTYQAAEQVGFEHHSVRPRITELFNAGHIIKYGKVMGPYKTRIWTWAKADPQRELSL